MIKVDLKDLDLACMLDDKAERTQATEALIASAHVLARQNSAHAFSLLLSALSDFARQTNVRLDLLQIAVLDLQMHLDDAANEAALALPAALTGDPNWQSKAIARMTPHDPTGSPVEAAGQVRIARAVWERARAADPDPRDDEPDPTSLITHAPADRAMLKGKLCACSKCGHAYTCTALSDFYTLGDPPDEGKPLLCEGCFLAACVAARHS